MIHIQKVTYAHEDSPRFYLRGDDDSHVIAAAGVMRDPKRADWMIVYRDAKMQDRRGFASAGAAIGAAFDDLVDAG